MNYTITYPKAPAKPVKDDEKAPAGSWLQHANKDKKNNVILWRNNHTDQRSYHLYYLPWDAPSSSGDELKYRKESLFVPMTGVPKKVPLGSWLQHTHDDGHHCWRNNHTHEIARKIWFSRNGQGSLSSPAPQVIVEAHPVATLKEPPEEKKKDPAPPVPPCKEKKKGAAVAVKSIIVRGHPWEETFHPVCGKKHWKHRDTGEIRLVDPFC